MCLRLLMKPSSIGWRAYVVFWDKKTSLVFFKLNMDGCDRQLSVIIANFFSSTWNFRASLWKQSSKIWLFIQLFFGVTYLLGKCFTFLKEQGFSNLLIINTGKFSPAALSATVAFAVTLRFFPLEYFSPLRW